MSYFNETGDAFRNQVSDLGIFDGMEFNGKSVNILKTPDVDRFEMTTAGYKQFKESRVDCFRDDYRFWDGCVWLGIRLLGLYDLLVKPLSPDKRPEVKIGNYTYQVFGMDDDANDATVKLTVRLKQ
jgi:hypothetical protein